MTLQHSKTWPVNTVAVVQLRVDPNGRAYSTFMDAGVATPRPRNEDETRDAPGKQIPKGDVVSMENENGVVLPLSTEHLEMFTKMSVHSFRTTVRTDTVSTILEHEYENEGDAETETGKLILESNPNRVQDDCVRACEKFHVLALARIEENSDETDATRNICRRPSIKVDNWDLVYTEAAAAKDKKCQNRCVEKNTTTAPSSYGCKTKCVSACNEHTDLLLPDIPLDARKVTTLRRHYYPEGGWGWVVIVCSVLVHVLNNGLQLSCSQLVLPAAGKFKTLPVHVAGKRTSFHIVYRFGREQCFRLNLLTICYLGAKGWGELNRPPRWYTPRELYDSDGVGTHLT